MLRVKEVRGVPAVGADQMQRAEPRSASNHGFCCSVIVAYDHFQPVQRIPRFELLLGRLLEATPRDHADYFELEKGQLCVLCASHSLEAIAVVRDVVKKINEQKRESEATAKLLFLEQNVKGLPKNLRFAHKRLIRKSASRQRLIAIEQAKESRWWTKNSARSTCFKTR